MRPKRLSRDLRAPVLRSSNPIDVNDKRERETSVYYKHVP